MIAMRRGWLATGITLGLAALTIAGCQRKGTAPPKNAAADPAPRPSIPRPTPPGGAPASFTLPDGDGHGGWRTINSGVSDSEAAWHLRAALNVAALSCDRTGNRGIASAYNQMLGRQKKALTAAYRAEGQRFGGAKALDGHVTQLYNFFAQPPAQARFCAVATEVAAEAKTVSPERFAAFAPAALARLTKPFDDFYHAFARYEIELAAWERGGPARRDAVRLAAAVPPVQPVATASGPPWRIQLGAYSGDRAAREAWGRIRSRMTRAADFEPRYEDVPASKLVRVRIGPVDDRATAIALCAAAAGAGLDCLPVPPKA